MRIVQIRVSDALKRFSYYVCNGLEATRLHHCAAKIRIIFEKRSFGELIFVIFFFCFFEWLFLGDGSDLSDEADGSDFFGGVVDWFVEDAGDDLGDGGVAGDVAGCAEAVHGYVEGYHEGVVGLGEAEHG